MDYFRNRLGREKGTGWHPTPRSRFLGGWPSLMTTGDFLTGSWLLCGRLGVDILRGRATGELLGPRPVFRILFEGV